MLYIDDHKKVPATGVANAPILQLLFRSHFLLATIASIISLGTWALMLTLGSNLHRVMLPAVWHAHEMIFGFGATVAAGFLLTAVQTWTKQPSLSGYPIIALIVLWILARIGFWVNTPNSINLAFSAQLLWWLAVIFAFGRCVINARNRRNYLFVAMLSVMAILNSAIIISSKMGEHALALHLCRSMVLMFVLLMTIMGGRVIPFFTANGLNVDRKPPQPWLEVSLMPLTLIAMLSFVSNFYFSTAALTAGLLVSCGLLNLMRQRHWHAEKTLKTPLLWSLHASYFCLGLGSALIGVSLVSEHIAFSHALHLITIAAMGLMIFAMMARVSLGHTGRALLPHPWINICFICVLMSAMIRVLAPFLTNTIWGYIVSIMLWLIAASLFLRVYTPILFKAKQSRF